MVQFFANNRTKQQKKKMKKEASHHIKTTQKFRASHFVEIDWLEACHSSCGRRTDVTGTDILNSYTVI
jgi:hypothetical protein